MGVLSKNMLTPNDIKSLKEIKELLENSGRKAFYPSHFDIRFLLSCIENLQTECNNLNGLIADFLEDHPKTISAIEHEREECLKLCSETKEVEINITAPYTFTCYLTAQEIAERIKQRSKK